MDLFFRMCSFLGVRCHLSYHRFCCLSGSRQKGISELKEFLSIQHFIQRSSLNSSEKLRSWKKAQPHMYQGIQPASSVSQLPPKFRIYINSIIFKNDFNKSLCPWSKHDPNGCKTFPKVTNLLPEDKWETGKSNH